MVHEYALQPELVAIWGISPEGWRTLREGFSLSKPRLISRFPKDWGKYAWNSFNSSINSSNDIDKKKMEELLVQLKERMVKRESAKYAAEVPWVINALDEDKNSPFHAILVSMETTVSISMETNEQRKKILRLPEIGEDEPLWECQHAIIIMRKPNDMVKPVAPLLRGASKIIFIDPYFVPGNDRYKRTLKAFLEITTSRGNINDVKIDYICKFQDEKYSHEDFKTLCNEHLPKTIPSGVRLRVRPLREKVGGEKLHNRYILTNLGGVSYSSGLACGDCNDNNISTDDLFYLNEKQYRERWGQYAQEPTAVFSDDEKSIEIVGTRVRKIGAGK